MSSPARLGRFSLIAPLALAAVVCAYRAPAPAVAPARAAVARPLERARLPVRLPGERAPTEPGYAPTPAHDDDGAAAGAVARCDQSQGRAAAALVRRWSDPDLRERPKRLLALAPKTSPPALPRE